MSRTKNTNLINHLATVRGFDRQAHFEAGGDLASWRGVHKVETNRYHEGAKRACRRPHGDDD
jgi:hypothetical protein